jgi:hypothetical protein
VKDFVPDVGFELRAVGFRIVSASRSARMLLDDARLPPDTDRTADVEVFASAPDREHVVIFSINSAYWASVTKYAPRPRLIIDTPCAETSDGFMVHRAPRVNAAKMARLGSQP